MTEVRGYTTEAERARRQQLLDDSREVARRAHQCLQEAKDHAGTGWSLLGPELRRALVCERLVRLQLMQMPSMWTELRIDLFNRAAQGAFALLQAEEKERS